MITVQLGDATDKRFGRHQVHDDRSRAYALTPVRLPTVPVMHESRAPIWDQGQIGSCTANAILGVLSAMPTLPSVLLARNVDPAKWTEQDAVDLYEQETRLDDRVIPGHYPPDDTGSAGIYSCQAVKARGWIETYRHAFSLTTTLGWLGRQPVSIGIPWYESMSLPGRGAVIPVDRTSPVVGGHQVCLDGVDPHRSLVRVRNSWGTGWGDAGRAWLTYADLGYLLGRGGDAVVVS